MPYTKWIIQLTFRLLSKTETTGDSVHCTLCTVHTDLNFRIHLLSFVLIEIIHLFSFLSCLNSIVFNSIDHQSLWTRREKKKKWEENRSFIMFLSMESFSILLNCQMKLSYRNDIVKIVQWSTTSDERFRIPFIITTLNLYAVQINSRQSIDLKIDFRFRTMSRYNDVKCWIINIFEMKKKKKIMSIACISLRSCVENVAISILMNDTHGFVEFVCLCAWHCVPNAKAESQKC